MGFFDRFKKTDKQESTTARRGFYEVKIAKLTNLTADAIMISFEIPNELNDVFRFIPGQYINVELVLNGKKERRAYSICSGPDELLSIAVKRVENGAVSNFLNDQKNSDFPIWISKPEGNFKLSSSYKNIVCLAAGSGITPIISMAKHLSENMNMSLFYGSQTKSRILFADELKYLSHVDCTHFLSQEVSEGFETGRLTSEKLTERIKEKLSLLQADAYFICGPFGLVEEMQKCLDFFGVPKEKIHIELFTPAENMSLESPTMFSGESSVKVMIDGENASFLMKGEQYSLLELVEKNGLDAPYSCRGGVCCSCRAKILKGSAKMRSNFSLTDEEVKNGYILTCQAFPTSEELIVSFDE